MKNVFHNILIVPLIKSIFCKPQIASWAPFTLINFGFSPEKHEDTLKVSTKTLTEAMSLRQKVESSA